MIEDFLNKFIFMNANYLIALFISLFGGFIIGAERELTNKWAGLRTHILVCVGACVFTLLSLYGFPPHANPTGGASVGDPARIAAQIITGIGFIGGGTVLRQGLTIQGLTTASTLWICAAIGMAAGCGKYSLSVNTTIFAIITLVIIRFVEKRFLHNNKKNFIFVKMTIKVPRNKQDEIYSYLVANTKNVMDFNSVKEDNKDIVKLTLKAEILKTNKLSNLHQYLSELEYVNSVSIQEILD